MRVLVVEDEKKVAAAVRRGLEAEGFAVDIALTGTDGLWMATENQYDAIVLDIMLPGMNGYKVCNELREAGNWTPDPDADGQGRRVRPGRGARHRRRRLPHQAVLVRRARRAHPRARAAHRERTDADLPGRATSRSNPGTHGCSRGDVEIPLTAREFSVLEFLMRRAGEVVSKLEILDNVWDFAFDGDPNIVEVYVRHLRRKLDEPFGRQLIQTIRGVGYRLDPNGG